MREQTTGTGAVERGSTTFTPGPWRLDQDDPQRFAVIDAYRLSVVHLESPIEVSDERAAANARLIAAAPDLYDALSAIVDDAEDWMAGRTNMTAPAYVELIRRRSVNALAKARGEAVPA